MSDAPSFFTSLARATTNALHAAQHEFTSEWSPRRPVVRVVSSAPVVPVPVPVPVTTASTTAVPTSPVAHQVGGNDKVPVVAVERNANVSPQQLAYLRSVYLRPPVTSGK
jgi:hypothetical protein